MKGMFTQCETAVLSFYKPVKRERERAAAKHYTAVDRIIQALKFEEGVAPSSIDLRGVPELSHYGDLVFVKKFIFQKNFRSYMRSEVSKRGG